MKFQITFFLLISLVYFNGGSAKEETSPECSSKKYSPHLGCYLTLHFIGEAPEDLSINSDQEALRKQTCMCPPAETDGFCFPIVHSKIEENRKKCPKI